MFQQEVFVNSPHCSPFPDYLMLDDSLTEEQRQVQLAVRNFVGKEVQPKIRAAYRDERFPLEVIPKLGALGVLGATLTDYGLPGMDPLSYGLAMRELERCDSGLRSFASVQGGLVMFPIRMYGSELQKRTWLPLLSSGRAVGCFCLTESEGGSDPGAMKTQAEDRGDHWLLKGSKMWITNGSIAQVAVVWAKTDQGIRGFVVPTETPGVRITRMEGKLSLRASVTSELYFDDVKLSKEALLPKSDGLKSALSCLNQARYSIVWGVLGAAEACFDEAVRYVSERHVFGKPLASYQLVQRKLALMATEITKGQLLAHRLAHLKAKEALHFSQVSMGKQSNVAMALEVARTCRDVLGANGIMDEYQVMRHLCNLETVFTYEGTNDIHLLVVSQQITGIAAF
jgi:glutaryl-CoA dehydrogenase